jgi:nucleoside-diphosphate-sugar epimerase
VILRPPLIYGPGAKGNLRALFKLMRSVVPLPLAALDNRRSLLGLSNLVQAIELALQVPGLGGETFYLQDATLSTPALLRAVAEALRRPARLFPMPAVWLAGAARLAGQADKFERLAGSLAISSAKFTRLTGWQPAIPLAVELERIAASPYL